MADSKNYSQQAEGQTNPALPKNGQIVTTIMKEDRVKDYPKTKYDIIEII